MPWRSTINRQGNVMELSGNFTLSGVWSPVLYLGILFVHVRVLQVRRGGSHVERLSFRRWTTWWQGYYTHTCLLFCFLYFSVLACISSVGIVEVQLSVCASRSQACVIRVGILKKPNEMSGFNVSCSIIGF